LNPDVAEQKLGATPKAIVAAYQGQEGLAVASMAHML